MEKLLHPEIFAPDIRSNKSMIGEHNNGTTRQVVVETSLICSCVHF